MMMMLWKQMASKSKNTPKPICHITFSSNGKNLKYETRAKKLWTLGGMSSPFSCLALDIVTPVSQCLKIIEKVAFNIASEASYVFFFRFIKKSKISLASFWKTEAWGKKCYQTGWLVETAKIETFKWDILGDDQTMCV